MIVDDSCPSTVGNDVYGCCVTGNTILSEIGNAFVTKSFNIPILDSRSSNNKCVTWSDFVVSINSAGSLESDMMSSGDGTAEGLVGICKSIIPVELDNGKA